MELSGYLDLHSSDTADSYLVVGEEEEGSVTKRVYDDPRNHTWTEVSESEFEAFVKRYRAVRKLEFNCGAISEPPLCSYNDFELDPMWPGSMVAKFVGWPKDKDKTFYLRDGVEMPGE